VLAGIFEAIKSFALGLGGPGLALLAFLDSSFLSFPEANDLLIVAAVVGNPNAWWYYALLTTIGSIAGCYALYLVGRRGGEAFLRKRFNAGTLDRGLSMYQRWGLLAVIVPSILPPPTPFKIFVLLAGVAKVRPLTFITAVAIGRGLRYGGEAWLAYKYGEQAMKFITENVATVGLILAMLLIAGAIAFVVWRRRQRQPA
jgi:membrane protein YqaA with SNARE-associated domain